MSKRVIAFNSTKLENSKVEFQNREAIKSEKNRDEVFGKVRAFENGFFGTPEPNCD